MNGWTLGLAIWATVVSTGLLMLRLVDFLRDRPNVQVEVSWEIEKQSDGSFEACWVLKAFNKGRRKILLTDCGLRLSNGGIYPGGGGDWFNTVEEQDMTRVEIRTKAIAEFLREKPGVFIKSVWFKDISGRYFEQEVDKETAKYMVDGIIRIIKQLPNVQKLRKDN